MLIGGTTRASIRRVVEFGAGWTAGGMPPDAVAAMAEKVEAAWSEAGREGCPRVAALISFGLGDAEEASRGYLLDYFSLMGSDIAGYIAGGAVRTPEAIKGAVDAYAQSGVDELILDPTVSNPSQVDPLAEVVF